MATRSSGRIDEIQALGARVREFDFRRSSLNPLNQVGTVRRIAHLIRQEAPDVVHVVAMQPMVLTAMAARFAPRTRFVMHLTGLGFLGISQGRAIRTIRPAAMVALDGVLSRPDAWLLAENPEDHGFLIENGVRTEQRVTILPGAGIDEAKFPALPQRSAERVKAAFVGRMIRSKGIEVLAQSSRLLRGRGIDIEISLYGDADADNPEAISEMQLKAWQDEGLLVWHGRVEDVPGIWRTSDICVLPSISREGMPRAVLEAASSQRPLIVTDVPGSRHFVRDGCEGLVVRPADANALAGALARLASDAELRARMGQAARTRILDGFTIDHVKRGIRDAYAGLVFQQAP